MDEQHVPKREQNEHCGKRQVQEEPAFHQGLRGVVKINGQLALRQRGEPVEVHALGIAQVKPHRFALLSQPRPRLRAAEERVAREKARAASSGENFRRKRNDTKG